MSQYADYLDSVSSDASRWAGLDPVIIRDAATELRRLEKVEALAKAVSELARYYGASGNYWVSANAMADLRAALATVEGTP